MSKAGYSFSKHSYYIIPYVPIMALISAYGILQIKNIRIQQLILLIIVIEGIANQQHDFRLKEDRLHLLKLETIADKVSKRSDLIAINGAENPTNIYFTHRKGWSLSNSEITDQKLINDLKNKGCKFLFINKSNFKDEIPKFNFNLIFEDDKFMVFRLN